jgi:hypothetical protein
LFFAIAILAVAVLAYMTLSKTQTLSYYPYKEIVESINTDFYNALTKILAITTQIYNQTAKIDFSRRNASQLFTFWYKVAQRTYSPKGLNISTSFDTVKLQPSKVIENVSLPELYVCGNLTTFYWNKSQAISAAEASLYINSAQHGFYGWKTKVLTFLNVTIQRPSNDSAQVVSFNLLVFSEKGPVNDLTNSNVVVWNFDPSTYTWKKSLSVNLNYVGNGNYSVTFTPNLSNKNDYRFWYFYYRFFLVQVKDNRGIIVRAKYISNKALHVYDYGTNGRIVVMRSVSQSLSLGKSFSVAWDAYVTNYNNPSGVGVVLQNVSVIVHKGNRYKYYSFLFLYGGDNIVSANGTNVTIDMSIPHTYNITITYIHLESQKNITAYFYVDSKQVNHLNISDVDQQPTINSVGAGSYGVSSTYDLYIDNVGMIDVNGKVTTEDFEDGIDNFFVNSYNFGNTGKEVVVTELVGVPY